MTSLDNVTEPARSTLQRHIPELTNFSWLSFAVDRYIYNHTGAVEDVIVQVYTFMQKKYIKYIA